MGCQHHARNVFTTTRRPPDCRQLLAASALQFQPPSLRNLNPFTEIITAWGTWTNNLLTIATGCCHWLELNLKIIIISKIYLFQQKSTSDNHSHSRTPLILAFLKGSCIPQRKEII